MDDVLAFCKGVAQWAKENKPILVWPTKEIETEVSEAVSTSTQTEIVPATETACTCPVPNQVLEVCRTDDHAPKVVYKSLDPFYAIPLPDDKAQLIDEFVPKGSLLVKIAGLSGVSAVALGAYGAHIFKAEEDADRKKVYDTANFYHFVHTLALLGVPLTKRPVLSGTLIITGTTIFCGTIYYHALTNEKQLRKYTPYGGIVLMMGWLSMIL